MCVSTLKTTLNSSSKWITPALSRKTLTHQSSLPSPLRIVSVAAKIVSRSAFQLKGGGWYSDLYAGPKPNGAKDQGASKDSTSKEASTASTSTTKSTKETKKSEAAA